MSEDALPPSSEPPPESPHQPHDKLFKSTFSDLVTAAAFLRTQVPPSLAATLDWSRLQLEEAGFIDAQLRGRACDLLYRAPCRAAEGPEREVWLYVLFEHQREEDPWLAFRLLGYMMNIWGRYRENHPEARKLPPILPLVLAQNARPWRGSTHFHDLIEAPAGWESATWALVPGFAYHLAQLAEMPMESFVGTPSGVLTLRLLKAEPTGSLLIAAVWDEALMAQLSPTEQERYFRYLYHCGDFDNESFARRLAQLTSPQLRATAMTFGQRLEQKGRQEGRQEGQILASQRHILELLEIRFERVPEGLREEIEAITDLERLSRLLRAAALSADLEAFSREL